MRIVFVSPYFTDNAKLFIDALSRLPGVQLGLVAQEDVSLLPHHTRGRIAGFELVGDALAPKEIVAATQRLSAKLGGVDRLLGVLEQIQIPIAEAQVELGLPSLGVETAKNFRDKTRMKDVLRAAGLPVARHRQVLNAAEAQSFAAEVGYPIIVKPPAGVASQATYRATDEASLAEATSLVLAAAQGVALLEEMVTGTEHSFDAFMKDGELLSYSITDYLPPCIVAMENPWIQWTALLRRDYEAPDIADVSLRTLRALGMTTGICHLEWFRRPDGSVVISEVGARPGGAQIATMISRAHDVDYRGALTRFMVHEAFEPFPPRKYTAGTAFLRGQGQGRVRAVHGYDRIANDLAGMITDVRLPSHGQQKAASYEGEGFITVRHPEQHVVEGALAHIVSNVRVELG